MQNLNLDQRERVQNIEEGTKGAKRGKEEGGEGK